jgi:hypothetical protein
VVYIYGSLFDLREPTLGVRPSGQDAGVPDSLRQGHFFKDGADEGPIELFPNTCVVLDPGAIGDDFGAANDAGFSYYVTIGNGEDPRQAFNNILVAAFTPGQVKPIAFLAPKSFPCQTNGNTFFRIPQEDDEDNFLVRRRNGPPGTNESVRFANLDDYHLHYWPNDTAHEYERDSKLKNPDFHSFDTDTGAPHKGDDLRLRPRTPADDPESPAWRAAVTMPDLLRDMYVAATGTVPTDPAMAADRRPRNHLARRPSYGAVPAWRVLGRAPHFGTRRGPRSWQAARGWGRSHGQLGPYHLGLFLAVPRHAGCGSGSTHPSLEDSAGECYDDDGRDRFRCLTPIATARHGLRL